jgi:hypothetical protein
MNPVSSQLEYIWISKNQLLKLYVCNFVAQMTLSLACRVPQNVLSNLSWSKNKSWSLPVGEEHIGRWHQLQFIFDPQIGLLPLLSNH